MITVIGGGLIGATIAFELQEAGADVMVLDAGHAGAAWAASAGLLAPSPEGLGGTLGKDGFTSLALWPGFARRLEERSGVRVDLRFGLHRVALSPAEREELRSAERGVWLDAPPVPVRGALGGRCYPAEGAVHPLRVREAALARLQLERCVVHSVAEHARGVRVVCDDGEREASHVVLAAGAWSGAFGLPVFPVQGQALLLDSAACSPPAFAGRGYLLSRSDGLYVGATERESRDTTPDHQARAWLDAYRAELSPEIAMAGVQRQLVGLRPQSRTGRPLVGPHPEHARVFVATGHYRNGALLAPLTARRAREWWEGSQGRSGRLA